MEELGGICILVQCDHSNDEQVKKVFDKIKAEQNGHLDVLVNNAYQGVEVMLILKKKYCKIINYHISTVQ